MSIWQNESCFRQDFLLKYKNRTEQDEIETRENLNRLLLENVLPAHVAALFVGENKKNEVRPLSVCCIRIARWGWGRVGWISQANEPPVLYV